MTAQQDATTVPNTPQDTPSHPERTVADIHIARPARNPLARWLWASGGTFSLTMGLIGVVVPGWPTTIFVIIAAACYARSSQRMYDWIVNNRLFGRHVRRYRETGGMPVKAKIFSLGVMWPFVLFAVFIAIPTTTLWPHAIVLALALIGTAYILTRPTDRGGPLPSELAAQPGEA
jgi:uncharacterized protein